MILFGSSHAAMQIQKDDKQNCKRPNDRKSHEQSIYIKETNSS
jgi:hypothetical protein